MKFRRKKQTQQAKMRHPQYLAGRDRTWEDDERENGGMQQVRKSFLHIIIVCVIILVIIVITATTAIFTSSQQQRNGIEAADTYAVSSQQQDDMKEKAQAFVTSLMMFSYCSDEDTAMQCKNAALACMAEGTKAYDRVESMEYGGGELPADSLRIFTTSPSMSDGSQTYAGTYMYSLDGVAVDTSTTDESNPDGTFIDSGYSFDITFQTATNDNKGEQEYMISSISLSYNG